MTRPIVKGSLFFLLVIAGLGSNPRPLVAQNPAPVMQSAGTIQASARVEPSEIASVSWEAERYADSLVAWLGRPDRLDAIDIGSFGVRIVGRLMEPPTLQADDPKPRVPRQRLQVSLIFTAN